jgi:hypothetical protein
MEFVRVRYDRICVRKVNIPLRAYQVVVLLSYLCLL